MADDFEELKKTILAPISFEAGAALYDCQSSAVATNPAAPWRAPERDVRLQR
jgi:hypothetical protein